MTKSSMKQLLLHICTFDVEMLYDLKARVGNEPGERLGGLGSSYLSGEGAPPPHLCNMKVEPLRRSCSLPLSFRKFEIFRLEQRTNRPQNTWKKYQFSLLTLSILPTYLMISQQSYLYVLLWAVGRTLWGKVI